MFGHGKSKVLILALVTVVLLGGLSQASASELLFGYGLPTQNLNGSEATGTYNENRSNGAAPTPDSPTLTPPYSIAGDKFTIGSEGEQYHIDSITVYMGYGYYRASDGTRITQYDTEPINESGIIPPFSLWFGPDGGTILNTNAPSTYNRVWFADGQNAQRPSDGYWYGIYQITFNTDLTINGGQTYDFFLDGTIRRSGLYHVPGLMVANQANSGVNPVGGTLDNAWYWYEVGTGNIIPGSSSYPPYQYADANVLIYGSQVPIPGSLLLLGSGLLGLGALGRRRRKC